VALILIFSPQEGHCRSVAGTAIAVSQQEGHSYSLPFCDSGSSTMVPHSGQININFCSGGVPGVSKEGEVKSLLQNLQRVALEFIFSPQFGQFFSAAAWISG
jgi:hypothetical protein